MNQRLLEPVVWFISFLFYYTSLFDQISKSIATSKSISTTQMLFLINDHNLVWIELVQLNLIIIKSVATFFISSAIIEHLFIYMAIYDTELFEKLFFSICAFVYLFGGCFIMSSISMSVNQYQSQLINFIKQCFHFWINKKQV